MKRSLQLVALVVVSLNNLAPQITALLLLAPWDFGAFSLGYLTFSFAASVTLSTVSEAYARTRPSKRDSCEPRNYAAISTWLSLVFALLAGVIFSLVSGGILEISLSMIAVGCAARRTTIRYNELRTDSWRALLTAETLALMVFIAAMSSLFANVEPILAILIAWSSAGITMWLFGTMRRPGTIPEALKWLKQYRSEIKTLLRESLMQDASALGTPYMIAPILGPASFGIYRAVSNFNVPVRLVFNFLRPALATKPFSTTLSAKYLISIASLSFGWGLTFALVLVGAARWPTGVAMLDALTDFWLPTGLYMMFTVGVRYFYILARTKVSPKNLWRTRLLHSSISIVFPVSGALMGGLTGAIWCYTVATVLGALIWYWVVQLQARRDRL